MCDDLGMTEYIIHADHRPYDQAGMKHKEKADLLEGKCRSLEEVTCSLRGVTHLEGDLLTGNLLRNSWRDIYVVV